MYVREKMIDKMNFKQIKVRKEKEITESKAKGRIGDKSEAQPTEKREDKEREEREKAEKKKEKSFSTSLYQVYKKRRKISPEMKMMKQITLTKDKVLLKKPQRKKKKLQNLLQICQNLL